MSLEISKNIDGMYVVFDGVDTFHYKTIESVVHHLKETDKQNLLCDGI